MEFATTVDTLCQRETESMLAVMFSGRHKLHMDKIKVVLHFTFAIHMHIDVEFGY